MSPLGRLVRSKPAQIVGITTLTLIGIGWLGMAFGQFSGAVEPWPFAFAWCAEGPGDPIATPELEAALEAQGFETVRKGGTHCSGGDVTKLSAAESSEEFLVCGVRWAPDVPLDFGIERSEPLRHSGVDLALGNVYCSTYTDDMPGEKGREQVERLTSAFESLQRSHE